MAGGGSTIGGRGNAFWDSTWRVTQKAYQALSRQAFRINDEIGFLTAGAVNVNLDANHQYDNLYSASKTLLQYGITQWAADAQDVVIYLAGQGGPGVFQINGTEMVTAGELNAWISDLQQRIPGIVTVIIDTNNSGGFVDVLSKQPKRYLLTSTRRDQQAVMANDGLNSFSYSFWSEIATGAKLQSAFKTARQAVNATLFDGEAIEAQVDADADGRFTELDYTALGDYCLGNCNQTAASAPSIQPPNPNRVNLNNTVAMDINVQVDTQQPLEAAWVSLQRSDDLSIDPSQPLNLTKLPLSCNTQAQCRGRYEHFNVQGEYRLQFYAMDSNKKISLPVILTVTQPQGQALYPVEYDASIYTINLRDVAASGQHYQAALEYQNGLFVLVASRAATSLLAQAAQYDAASGFLSIPLARVFGQDYSASLKNMGDFRFNLESANPIGAKVR